MSSFENIQELLREKADIESRLKILPYKGTPEIKSNSNGKYIYIRKRELGKLTSSYVAKYSEELYSIIVKSTQSAKQLYKRIKQINRELANLDYSMNELSPRVILNLDFARTNMKSNIYDQAILEGVTTTYPQTETIIENGIVSGMTASDVQKVLNLLHAWEFILNMEVIAFKSDFYVLSYIAKLVNEGFYGTGGRIRGVPVKIGGSNYIPPLPIETVIKEDLEIILSSGKSTIDIAIELCLYCMKKQIFIDGNKRTAVIFANHFLISNGEGLLVIPSDNVTEFKSLLIKYYEGTDTTTIKQFLKNKCWRKF